MGLLRSEKMGYYDLIMPSDSAWAILNELGRLSNLQFVDVSVTQLNSSETIFNRRYASYIRRCEEAERRLRFLSQEMQRFKIETVPVYDYRAYLLDMDEMLSQRDSPPQTYLEQLEQELIRMEDYINDQVKSYEKLMEHYNELVEHGIVLEKTKRFFFPDENIYREVPELPMNYNHLFNVLTGVIDKQDVLRFKRMIFRATRGNSLTLSVDVDEKLQDPHTEVGVEKSVFLILYPGAGGEIIENKLMRICDSFGAHRYNVPKDKTILENAIESNRIERTSSYEITQRTHDQIVRTLRELAQPRKLSGYSKIEEYRLYVLKEKGIYHHMNMFQLRNHIFYGNCWCPKKQAAEVTTVLNEMTRRYPSLATGQLRPVDGPPPAHFTTPTYFKLNDFTRSFQEIVDTYGVPRYQEANPTLFTCVTFPFLFGIMFGDIGHGLILTAFATYLCFNKETLVKGSGLLTSAVPARYLLLMMGLCAMYCGFIYNDFLGIPFDFFGSRWAKHGNDDQMTRDSVYPFGMDPMWYKASNELVFFNSFKMKTSVIFGVTQMIIGVLFKGLNTIHFKSKIDFFCEFVPQLIFISAIFGYMLFMIIVKWLTDWRYNWDDSAPNLISVTMNMFLKLGQLEDQTPLWGDKQGQESLQLSLMLIAVVCVPWMWLIKPLYERSKHNKHNGHLKEHHPELNVQQKYQEFDEGQQVVPKVQEFDFGEEFVHQTIETIEYVLGCVSNTASYLRLWALSLAHGQLSKVFFEKCIASTIETGNPLLVVVGFFVFANVTVGVLMAMDAMECFLHALRLHWVEFQNKFYKGDGIKFMPFSFENTFAGEGK